jgi:hypothetical protein
MPSSGSVGIRPQEHRELVPTAWQPLLPKLRVEEIACEQSHQFLPTLAFPGDDLDNPRSWLIGQRRFEYRPTRAVNQVSVLEFEGVVGGAFTVDSDLCDLEIFPVKGRPIPIKDIHMDIF